jgi:hypothetical protein
MAMLSLLSIDRKRLMIAVAACLAIGQGGAAPPHQPLSARATVLKCPASLATTQSAASIAGWQAYHPTGNNTLEGYGFYEGPVIENAELAPSDEHKVGKITMTIWSFEGHTRPTYLACNYNRTSIVLSRQLPPTVRRCTIKSDSMKPAAEFDVVTCQ